MVNLWHQLASGPNPPDVIYVIVEIAKGSRNKYEYGKELGIVKLDRVLYSSLHYPGDYGLIPRTFYEDGDPLDVLVMVSEPTFPGCVIEARPIGLFKMKDKGLPDDKVLCVPDRDPFFKDYRDLDDVPQHFLREVAHFFEVYKDLEGVRVEPMGWERADAAKQAIRTSISLYQEKYSRGMHV
jgi:inorganic pyrophosphatase